MFNRMIAPLAALTDFASTDGKLPSAAALLAGGLTAARLSPASSLDAIYLASAARLSRNPALANEATLAATDTRTRVIVGGEIAVLDPAASLQLLTDAQQAIEALPAGPERVGVLMSLLLQTRQKRRADVGGDNLSVIGT